MRQLRVGKPNSVKFKNVEPSRKTNEPRVSTGPNGKDIVGSGPSGRGQMMGQSQGGSVHHRGER